MELHADADFAGNWDPALAGDDVDTARSRHGYVLSFAGVPIIWKSQLQSEVALSSTEAEVIGLSAALRTAIPIVNMVDEMADLGFPILANQREKQIHCKVFEDNSGALDMVRLPKMRPRTKHICVRMHHFREHVRTGKVTIHKVPSRYQLADIATKPQRRALFESQRGSLMQWESEFRTREETGQAREHLRACDIVNEVSRMTSLEGQPAPNPASPDST